MFQLLRLMISPQYQPSPCGPDGTHWLTKLINKIIPQSIFGVSIAQCCEEHDISWTEEANKAGDEAFKECLRCQFRKAGWSKRMILLGSGIGYLGVRFGNLFYKLGGK